MSNWNWLTDARKCYDGSFLFRVLVKALVLFVLLNVLYAVVEPFPVLSKLSLYQVLEPRPRLSYSDNPAEALNLSYPALEGLFAAHEISVDEKADNEYRVLLIGDSSVWGVLLSNSETLSACVNQSGLQTQDGRQLKAYNLGYPVLSLFKDLMILRQAMEYDPDAVVWMVTLQAFYANEQLRHPITQTNTDSVEDLIQIHELDLATDALDESGWFERTLVGQRRLLSDWLRYQVYALGWWMTGKDYAPARFLGAPVSNLAASEEILNQPDIEVGNLLTQNVLAEDVFFAGLELMQSRDIDVVIVNEPIFRSSGLNSDLRYNEYYPRWAYDEYRQWLAGEMSVRQNLIYMDLWDFVPSSAFTDTPFHYRADFVCQVADQISAVLIDMHQ